MQYQTGTWVKLTSLVIGDRFGITFKTTTSPFGTFVGSNNYVFDVTGGTPGAYTYTSIAPLNGDARSVSNDNSIYHGISYTYSTSLGEWVQLSANVNATYGNGLQSVSNIISLGNLTANWNQTGLFALNTAGNISTTGAGTITSAGLLTASSGLTLSSGALNMTSTSGAISIQGLGASTISSTSNNLTFSTVTSGTLALISAGALNHTQAASSTWTLNNATNALNFDSNTLSIDALNNRVGIGTAAPSWGLSMVRNSNSSIANLTNVNTTDATTDSILRLSTGTAVSGTLSRFIQFYAGATTDSNGTGVGRIQLNNAGVQFTSGGADLAEWSEVVAGSYAAGDIISAKNSGNQKAVTGDLILGVISDTAAFVGNDTFDADGNVGKETVGMLGRVNTKVDITNGNIAIGDPITPSSVAGVGMKQTKAGPTIGKALAAKTTAGVERIAVQVVPGWYDPDALLSPGAFTVSGTDILQNGIVVTRAGGFQDLKIKNLTVSGSLTFPAGSVSHSFDLIASGTNTTAAMLVGTGASLSFTGAGTINASSLGGATFAAPGAIGSGTANTGTFTTLSATTFEGSGLTNCSGSGQKLLWDSTTKNFSCGSDRATVSIKKSSNETCVGNSGQCNGVSTVLQNDNELTFAVNAGETWVVQYVLPYTSPANADIKMAVTAPTSSTCSINFSNVEDGSGVGGVACGVSSDTLATANTVTDTIEVTGTIVTTTAGNITLQWSQDTAQNTATTVYAGSYLLAYKISGADLAEAYGSSDNTIQPGDVVVIDDSTQNGVQKSKKTYDSSVLGIVSTKPGLVLGNETITGKLVLVALSGRVPVKVSTENGEIKAGDYLTTSSTPGVAMKATEPGATIGTSMSNYNGKEIGTVMVFVKNGEGNSGKLADITNREEVIEAATTNENEILDIISKKITEIFKNTMEFFEKVIFQGDVNFVGRPTFNKDTAGFAIIKSGSNEVEIKFEKEYENEPVINISPNIAGEINISDLPKYVVADVNTKGFKIRLNQSTGTDLRFSWSALAIENPQTTTSSTTPPTPTPSTVDDLPSTIPPTSTPSPEIILDASPSAEASPSASTT